MITLSITLKNAQHKCHSASSLIMLNVIFVCVFIGMLNVILLSVILLSVILLSAILQSVALQSDILHSVMAPYICIGLILCFT